ncbi:hypothetical protein DN752_08980 [Echinicola strongylocentroti]|uniref:Uncharacterized protein n=1 Tax=Echinicola strongylocentroti TaxID=1795355 RepID=A0A2Z4IIA4_9BACT|nr:hypothetical protein [Echinicola strongylocentroti]AWW30248.1 hypothetical protein DN752_08980 [Echinicola strongylocentroti]
MENIMDFKRSIVLLGLVVILGSCGQEEETPDYPVTMTFDKIVTVSEMRVFAGGELLDSNGDIEVIGEFLDRYYSIGSTSYNSKFVEPGANYGDGAEITFFADGRIHYASQIIEVKRKDGTIIMKSKVTNEVEDFPLVESDFFKYPYDVTDNGRYSVHHVMYGDERSALDVALQYFKLVRYDKDDKLVSVDFGTRHNEFDEDFLESLTDRDTLALKSYRLKYSVK